jgi:transposase
MAEPKKQFTPEFRAEAVRLAQTSGRSRREVAADLGIGLSTLRNWIDGRRDREMDASPVDRQEDMAAELKSGCAARMRCCARSARS